jgi:hypothetical protein
MSTKNRRIHTLGSIHVLRWPPSFIPSNPSYSRDKLDAAMTSLDQEPEVRTREASRNEQKKKMNEQGRKLRDYRG